MNAVSPVSVELTGPPTTAAPPGDPPEGFDRVLAAEQERTAPETEGSARTADAEGARESGDGAEPGVADDAVPVDRPDEPPSEPPVPRGAIRADEQRGDPPAADEIGARAAGTDRTEEGAKPTLAELPPGLAKRDSLPPGLAGRETLPPGLAKRGTDVPVDTPAPVAAGVGDGSVSGSPPEQATMQLAPTPATPTLPETASAESAPGRSVSSTDAPVPPSLPGTEQSQYPAAPVTGGPVAELPAAVDTRGAAADGAPATSGGPAVRVAHDTPRTGHAASTASPSDRATSEPHDDGFGLAPSAPLTTAVAPTGATATGTPSSQAAGAPSGASDQVAAPTVPISGQPLVETRDGVSRGLPEQPVRTRLTELAEAAGTVIRLAARDGKTTARITLRPAELGEVEIRLRYHGGGLSADVVAESPQAAQTLQQSIGDLRRTLESQGVVVHWLDVRTSDEGRRSWQEASHPGRGRAVGRLDPTDGLDEPSSHVSPSGLPAPAGTVDVLA